MKNEDVARFAHPFLYHSSYFAAGCTNLPIKTVIGTAQEGTVTDPLMVDEEQIPSNDQIEFLINDIGPLRRELQATSVNAPMIRRRVIHDIKKNAESSKPRVS